MLKKFNKWLSKDDKLEKDAAAIPSRNEEMSVVQKHGQQVSESSNSQMPTNLNQINNIININESEHVHIGNKITIQPPVQRPNRNQPMLRDQPAHHREKRYELTKTIKNHFSNNAKLTNILLDIVAESLGARWKDFVREVLRFEKPLSEYTELDNKDKGFKQVAYRHLELYFSQNPENCTVAWLFESMWSFNYREQVHYIKDKMKKVNWNVPDKVSEPSDLILELMESKKKLDEMEIDCFAQCLGSKWETICVILDIEKSIAELIEKDYKEKGYKEVAYQTILHYFQENPDNKYMGWLVTHFWNAEFYDELQYFCEKIKEIRSFDSNSFETMTHDEEVIRL